MIPDLVRPAGAGILAAHSSWRLVFRGKLQLLALVLVLMLMLPSYAADLAN